MEGRLLFRDVYSVHEFELRWDAEAQAWRWYDLTAELEGTSIDDYSGDFEEDWGVRAASPAAEFFARLMST